MARLVKLAKTAKMANWPERPMSQGWPEWAESPEWPD